MRVIKPEISMDEELGELGFAARWFFICLLCHCDREGRCEDRPKVLQAKILPWDREVDADQLLNELHPHFVVRYEIAGKNYLWVRNFKKHQRPKDEEQDSVIPPPSREYLEGILKVSQRTPIGVDKVSHKPMGKGKWEVGSGEREVGIGEGTGGGTSAPLRGLNQDGFDQFWDSYPKKVGKEAARKIWKRLKPPPALQALIVNAILEQKGCDQWTKDGGQFIPNPATWLNQGRWQDEILTPVRKPHEEPALEYVDRSKHD